MDLPHEQAPERPLPHRRDRLGEWRLGRRRDVRLGLGLGQPEPVADEGQPVAVLHQAQEVIAQPRLCERETRPLALLLEPGRERSQERVDRHGAALAHRRFDRVPHLSPEVVRLSRQLEPVRGIDKPGPGATLREGVRLTRGGNGRRGPAGLSADGPHPVQLGLQCRDPLLQEIDPVQRLVEQIPRRGPAILRSDEVRQTRPGRFDPGHLKQLPPDHREPPLERLRQVRPLDGRPVVLPVLPLPELAGDVAERPAAEFPPDRADRDPLLGATGRCRPGPYPIRGCPDPVLRHHARHPKPLPVSSPRAVKKRSRSAWRLGVGARASRTRGRPDR